MRHGSTYRGARKNEAKRLGIVWCFIKGTFTASRKGAKRPYLFKTL